MLFRKRLYADAAAATPLSPRARGELVRLLDLYGNAGALYKEGVAAKEELEKARRAIAESIGAHPDEIIFTSGGTEANNLAIHGVLVAGQHAITSAIEHPSVLEPLRAAGVEVSELPVDGEGLVAPKEIAEAVKENTALVSVQLINSEVGTIEPVREIAKVLRHHPPAKVYLHTDASQAPLWMDIKVEKLGVDLMTLDAQKVMGPKGIGVLYCKRGVKLEPLLYGGGQERGVRSGTPDVPLAGAFAVALEDAQEGVENRIQRIAEVRDFLWSEIKKEMPNVVLNGPSIELGMTRSTRVANNLNISIPNLDGQMAVIALDALGIAASTRSACDTAEKEPSHVLMALGIPKEQAKGAIRITLLPDATKSDASRIARALSTVAKRYRTVV